jgi:hypothetical protein
VAKSKNMIDCTTTPSQEKPHTEQLTYEPTLILERNLNNELNAASSLTQLHNNYKLQ